MLATFAFDVCHDVYRAAREVIDTKIPTLNLESSGKYMWHPDRMPRLGEYVCDFATGRRAGAGRSAGTSLPVRASRMAMFRVYYLGGADYQAARRHLGISELTWADWAEEIRTRVGRELTRSGVFPPSKYFHESSIAAPENASEFQTQAGFDLCIVFHRCSEDRLKLRKNPLSVIPSGARNRFFANSQKADPSLRSG